MAASKSLTDRELAASPVVANSAMNRQRVARGANSYAKELGFDPVAWIADRLATRGRATWLDLCCGEGRALAEAADTLAGSTAAGSLRLVGIDLVDAFAAGTRRTPALELHVASLANAVFPQDCDLVTCIHGLHYVGDKLGAIARAAAALGDEGRFVAHLDPTNLRFDDGRPAARLALAHLRRHGFAYDARRHLITCEGRRHLPPAYRHVGADDGAGPNVTGQPAVTSIYTR